MKKMTWKFVEWTLLLLCGPLMMAFAEKNISETQVTTQQMRLSPQTLSYVIASITNDNATQSPEETLHAVSLPPMPCTNDSDCLDAFKLGDLVCRLGQCTCRPPYCWVYRYEVTELFTATYLFSCGECGTLGSTCNATIKCDYPGECSTKDGFCHCQSGENYGGVCLTSNFGWFFTLALTTLGIIVVCAVCIFAAGCFREPPWRNPEAWHLTCCKWGGTHRRRNSCEKSPAFTIQAHYANQGLEDSENNDSVAASAGLSGATPRRHRNNSTGNTTTVSSTSSATTDLTIISDLESEEPTTQASSLVSVFPPSLPPHHYLNSDKDDDKDCESDISRMQLKDITCERLVLPSTSNTSENFQPENISISESCTHERCQLCLPRSHISHPRRNITKLKTKTAINPIFPLLITPQVEDGVQLTQL